uniref:Uncharacterized protein n=1 Tax=Lepeophtheirus salmonis TaxID=72036 RepID=A0A0K2UP34_LEPSM
MCNVCDEWCDNCPRKQKKSPYTVIFPAPRMTMGSGASLVYASSRIPELSSKSSYIASKSAIIIRKSIHDLPLE